MCDQEIVKEDDTPSIYTAILHSRPEVHIVLRDYCGVIGMDQRVLVVFLPSTPTVRDPESLTHRDVLGRPMGIDAFVSVPMPEIRFIFENEILMKDNHTRRRSKRQHEHQPHTEHKC